MRSSSLKELLKRIRAGVRLGSTAPQVIRDKSKYTRKEKHNPEE